MITLYMLTGEKVKSAELNTAETAAPWLKAAGKGIVWLRCVAPDAASLELLSAMSGIAGEHFKEVIEEEERPKLTSPGHLEIVYSVPTIEEGDVVTTPFYIYHNNNLVLTIEKKRNAVTEALVSDLSANKRKFLFRKNPGTFVSYLLDKFNDDFLRYIDRISVRVDVFRERKEMSKDNIEKIYDSSVTLSYFNQALIANLEVLSQLRKSYYRPFTQENRKQFTEIYYDMLQVLDTEKIQRESISNLFNLQAVIASNKLNEFMKRVTLLAILVTVPAMISGVYGMNVPLPLQDKPYIFPALIALMVTVSLTLVFAFRVVEKRR